MVSPQRAQALTCAAAVAAACGLSDAAPTDPEPDGAISPTTGGELVKVSHERALRGMWIPTVDNILFPSQPGLPENAQKAELTALLDAAAKAGLNAVFFQVRPEGDALYESEIEPWSRFLTGTQGEDPGYDPLAFLIEQARERSIEVHAWLNPYRAKADAEREAAATHVAHTMPEHMRAYGSLLWMDPGAKQVRDHTVAVVRDLADRYAIDGVHFDDYFYPYPSGDEFPDADTYGAYLDTGGTMDLGEWRRDNVNRLIQRVSAALAGDHGHVRFGVSPFGIYRPGIPEGIRGLDQYGELFADPVAWMEEGWLDYLAPQLYWPSSQPEQDYATLLAWWSQIAGEGRYVFAGNFVSMLATEEVWSVDEFRHQLDVSRTHRGDGSKGNIFYHGQPIIEDRADIATVLRDEYYSAPALTPPVAAMRHVPVEPPNVSADVSADVSPDVLGDDGFTVELSHPEPGPLRAWVVYEHRGGEYEIDRIVPAQRDRVELSAGRWAISAAGRHGVESSGVTVELSPPTAR